MYFSERAEINTGIFNFIPTCDGLRNLCASGSDRREENYDSQMRARKRRLAFVLSADKIVCSAIKALRS